MLPAGGNNAASGNGPEELLGRSTEARRMMWKWMKKNDNTLKTPTAQSQHPHPQHVQKQRRMGFAPLTPQWRSVASEPLATDHSYFYLSFHTQQPWAPPTEFTCFTVHSQFNKNANLEKRRQKLELGKTTPNYTCASCTHTHTAFQQWNYGLLKPSCFSFQMYFVFTFCYSSALSCDCGTQMLCS